MSRIGIYNKSAVVFVDWHGVMSKDVFWKSILNDENHRYRNPLYKILSELFASQCTLLDSWITGHKTSSDIIKELHIDKIGKRGHGYWKNLLLEDCINMEINIDLLAELKRVKSNAYLVLATDNMDCFAETARQRKDLKVFDDILCSSEIGCIKKENPYIFFGKWLENKGLTPQDCLLLDDRDDNCEAFRNWGGNAIQLTYTDKPDNKVFSWIQEIHSLA